MGLIGLIAIGLISLVVTFIRMPSNQVFINGNNLKGSAYSLNLYDSIGVVLFSISPLNDYSYSNTSKSHSEDKITSADDGGFIQNLWLSVNSLILNKKELVWNTKGNSQIGKTSLNYAVYQTPRGLEIHRTIVSQETVNALGQVIKFCPDCLVTDDKNKVYFNADTVEQWDIDIATRLNLTPVIVGENQFLPPDVSLIRIIDRRDNLKMEIPLNGAQVYLQYKWRLLEFKIELAKNQHSVKQDIYLYE